MRVVLSYVLFSIVWNADAFNWSNKSMEEGEKASSPSTRYAFVCDNNCYSPPPYFTSCCKGCMLNGVLLPEAATGNYCTGGCSGIGLTQITCVDCTPACFFPGSLVTLYRFAQSGTGDHLYSLNSSVNAGTNYVTEASLGKCIAGTASGLLPLYEYVEVASRHFHFYTTNATEGAALVSAGTFTGGNVVCSIWPTISDTLYAIYRYSSGSGIYLLTTCPAEIGFSGYWTRQPFQGFIMAA